jgi:hypothetical protein
MTVEFGAVRAWNVDSLVQPESVCFQMALHGLVQPWFEVTLKTWPEPVTEMAELPASRPV